MSEQAKCDRVAAYTLAFTDQRYTVPVPAGVTPPASLFRRGEYYTLTAVLTSEDVPVVSPLPQAPQ